MIKDSEKLLDRVKKHVSAWNSGHLRGEMNFRFYTKRFLSIVFLYINSVDVKNPDLTGRGNKNTFINEALPYIEKIKEQIRLDLVDINFRIFNSIDLGKFVVKAANTKFLEENKFDVEVDKVSDDAVDFGSGILKVWKGAEGKLKMRSSDPMKVAWRQDDFEGGAKVEESKKTYRQIFEDKRYDPDAIERMRKEVGPDVEDKWDETVVVQQYVKDVEDKKQEMILTVSQHDAVLMHETTEKVVHYFKYDYKKRRGFKDALGVGCYEVVFNRLVQSKTNRARLDKLMELASKGLSQKELDGEKDPIAGHNLIKTETGGIIGHKGNKIEPLDLGYDKSITHVKNEIESMVAGLGGDMNVGEALQGNTLPSGTSGVLGNLLTENSASVLRDKKVAYGNFLGHAYQDGGIKSYLLAVFDKHENLEKYLSPNDFKMVKKNIVGYKVALKQVEAEIDGEPFNEASARDEAMNEMKGKSIIPGELLDSLRADVEGITLYITGEKFSKANAVAFLREMRTNYSINPALFSDPVYVEMLKQEAELEVGLDAIQIEEILDEVKSAPTPAGAIPTSQQEQPVV